MFHKPTGKHLRGRPRQRFQDRLNAEMRKVDGTAYLETPIRRKKWRSLIEIAKGLSGS